MSAFPQPFVSAETRRAMEKLFRRNPYPPVFNSDAGNSAVTEPVKAVVRIDTGTGPDRRRLTEAEAQAGGIPTPFTPREWDDMHMACASYVLKPNVSRFAEVAS